MGFNTVAFLLNDFMDYLERSPKTVVWALTHPPYNDDPNTYVNWQNDLNEIAEHYEEPKLHLQALKVLGTFHADHTQYFRAGGNSIQKLKVLRHRTETDKKTGKKRNTITLELPDWWEKGRHW